MKVRGNAFIFGTPVEAENADVEAFFDWADSQPKDRRWPPQQPDDREAQAYTRQLYVSSEDDLWCGVFISAKNTDISHHIEVVEGVIKIVPKEIGKNPPVELNFFCMRKDSLKGIYSNYPSSYPFSMFLRELWGAYLMFVRQKKVEAEELPNRTKSKAEIAKEYSYTGHGTHSALFDPKDYEALVKQLTKLTELSVTTWETDAPSDEPAKNSIRNVHKTYRFVKGQSPDAKIMSWIKTMKNASTRFTKAGKPTTTGSVKGEKDDKEFTIHFEHNLEDYLRFEHNKIGEINMNEIAKNPCMAKMIEVVRDQITFLPETEDE